MNVKLLVKKVRKKVAKLGQQFVSKKIWQKNLYMIKF
jgi:hypothetical protein